MPRGVRLRSLLFAPADDHELVAKLPRSQPDGVVLDLEDGTPADRKAAARDGLAGAIASLPGDVVVCVRVNAPETPWYEDDLAALPARVAYVMIPKVHAAVDIRRDVIAGIETARGVLDVRAALGGSVVAAYFGAEDYVADLGGVRTKTSHEVHYARSRVALACRVHGVHALDQVVVDVHDDDAFRADARRGRELGYRGKLCVHPRQVALAHEAFTPSEEEVAHARRVLDAGDGVVLVDGAMVDEPMRRAARAVLDAARGDRRAHRS